MKINFTNKEYGLLIDMLEIADWMMNAHYPGDNPDTINYENLIQRIYSYAKEMNYEHQVIHEPKNDKYYPTKEWEENGKPRQFIEEYEEQYFWEELVSRLAQRDLHQQFDQTQLEEMTLEERFTHLGELESWYDKEFEEHGLLNLKIFTEKKKKIDA